MKEINSNILNYKTNIMNHNFIRLFFEPVKNIKLKFKKALI